MKQAIDQVGSEDSVRYPGEVHMDAVTEIPVAPPAGLTAIDCVHGRLIDEVLTRSGRRSGKVRCLECGKKFEDPYRGLK